MNKAAATVLLASGLASAKVQEIDVFNPMNFANVDVAKTLIQSVSNPVNAGTGTVTWGTCPQDFENFNFDESSSTYTPNPITKGSDLVFNIAGFVTEKLDQSKVNIDVKWNGTKLYNHDFVEDLSFDSSYEYSLSFKVPSFAPSGQYDVVISSQGKSASGSGKAVCVTAQMQL